MSDNLTGLFRLSPPPLVPDQTSLLAEALNQRSDPRLAANYRRNAKFALTGDYATALPPGQELAFRQWVRDNNVPFDVGAAGPSDYDMRGFYQGLMAGHPAARAAVDPNDNRLHYPDFWKTPYHETFSAQSQWAGPGAPDWNEVDQLVTPDGRVLFDDRARQPPRIGAARGNGQ